MPREKLDTGSSARGVEAGSRQGVVCGRRPGIVHVVEAGEELEVLAGR
jgi:hypothetical protein